MMHIVYGESSSRQIGFPFGTSRAGGTVARIGCLGAWDLFREGELQYETVGALPFLHAFSMCSAVALLSVYASGK